MKLKDQSSSLKKSLFSFYNNDLQERMRVIKSFQNFDKFGEEVEKDE